MANSSNVSLKLLIDTKAQRVLFGEADKDFIDFLFNLLSLPLGTVIKLIKNKTTTCGSIGNIYKSVETMSDKYLQADQDKDTILKPKFTICSSTKLLPNIESSSTVTIYLCTDTDPEGCIYSVSDGPNATCPCCKKCMTVEGTYVTPPSESTEEVTSDDEEGGYVKGVVTYMVMDDLTVTPMSTISSITLLKKFDIKDVDSLEEKVITLDVNEGVKLLEVSLHSTTVLTDVFLGKILTTLNTSSKEKDNTMKKTKKTKKKKKATLKVNSRGKKRKFGK